MFAGIPSKNLSLMIKFLPPETNQVGSSFRVIVRKSANKSHQEPINGLPATLTNDTNEYLSPAPKLQLCRYIIT